MRITVAGFGDLEEIVRLEREVAEVPHWPEREYAAIFAGEGGGVLRRCLLVAKEEKEVAGFAVGKVVDGEAELESVAVRASTRRCGVGRALCEAVMAWAWAEGAVKGELEVRVSSAGAIALYRGLGFVEVGRRRGYYAQPVEDAVLMTLARGPHPGRGPIL